MISDDLEFLISQFVDGTLDPEQAAALETRLRSDPAARALLADHRRINTLLLGHTALPAVRFERLAAVISDKIDKSSQLRIEVASRAAYGRWVAGTAAVAACLLVGLLVLRGDRGDIGTLDGPVAQPQKPVAIVAGPTADAPPGAPVAVVSIDAPAGSVIYASIGWQDVAPTGARIVVSAGEEPRAPDPLSGY